MEEMSKKKSSPMKGGDLEGKLNPIKKLSKIKISQKHSSQR